MSQILIIYTGGTIGMMSDPKTKVLKPINFEQIMDNVPELEKLNCESRYTRLRDHRFIKHEPGHLERAGRLNRSKL